MNSTRALMTETDRTMNLPVDVEAKLHQLEIMVAEAKNVPLSASIMLNREEIDGLVTELREALPEEIRQARWILKERHEILDKAKREATKLIEEAQAERDRLVSRTDVVQAANREADRILEEAHESGRKIRLEAEDYVDAKLANFEVVLQKTIAAVERGREKLRGRLDQDELMEESPEEDWPQE
jgi:F0F1-type ATP synthase membrane subunit b/b'